MANGLSQPGFMSCGQIFTCRSSAAGFVDAWTKAESPPSFYRFVVSNGSTGIRSSSTWDSAYRIVGRRTVGLHVIKHEGGVAIVPDPKDALFPSMPESAIRMVPVDYSLPATQISEKVVALVNERWTDKEPSRANEIARDTPTPELEKMKEEEDERWMGKRSAFTCPDCNGTLWEVQDGGLLRFCCRIGHAFSGDGVRAGYSESVEAALWAAVRLLEESAALENRLGELALERGDKKT